MDQDKSFNFTYLSEKLGIEIVPAQWKDSWGTSMKSFPEEGIYFLENGYFDEANKILLLEEEALIALKSTAEAIRREACLCTLAWHCRCVLLAAQEKNDLLSCYFPAFFGYHNSVNDLFYAIVLIASLEDVVRMHEKRGIPRQVTMDTLGDLGLWMKHFYQTNGRWGLGEREWLARHFTGKLYRLGRLQFAYATLQDNIKVFRNTKNANVIALSGEGVNFRGDGQVNGTNNIFDQENGWVSSYYADHDHFNGNLISPYGSAIRHIHKLSKEQWNSALSQGDSILEVHIPAGDSISRDLCGCSFQMAMELLPRCFPERKFKAFTCNTWLFDTKFQELLPPFSNVVRFQREFYIYPVLGSDKQTYERVFGKKLEDFSKDFSTAPRDTLMRRVILDYYSEGGHLSNKAGFILNEDLNWGSEAYQKGWEELLEEIKFPIGGEEV